MLPSRGLNCVKKNDYEYRITNPWMNTTGTTKGDDDIPEIK